MFLEALLALAIGFFFLPKLYITEALSTEVVVFIWSGGETS